MLWNLFSLDQSCHLWVMWSSLITECLCWSDFSFQPWQNVFPFTWRTGWQHPIKLHLLATCPLNAVTDGSFLLEQLKRPWVYPDIASLTAASEDFSSGANKTLNHRRRRRAPPSSWLPSAVSPQLSARNADTFPHLSLPMLLPQHRAADKGTF